MSIEVKARYSRGRLDLLEPVDPKEGALVFVSLREASPEEVTRPSFEKAAGGWKGLVDTEALLEDFKESRKISSPEITL